MTRPYVDTCEVRSVAGVTGGVIGTRYVRTVQPGKYLAAVHVRLQPVSYVADLTAGGQIAIIIAVTNNLPTPGTIGEEGTLRAPGPLVAAGYISSVRGMVVHPNLWCTDEDAGRMRSVVIEVWCRDDVSASDILATVQLTWSDRPIPGADDYQRVGDCIAGTGALVRITTSDPAAGTLALLRTPGVGLRERVVSMRGTLVTSGVAGSRIVAARVRDGSDLSVGDYHQMSAIIASQTAAVTWGEGLYAAASSNLASNVGIPHDLMLAAGWDLVVVAVLGGDAGDNWGVFELLVEQWVIPRVAAS